MRNGTIPFGWHRGERKWKAPGEVPRGLFCGCFCHYCEKPLEAVHPRRKNRVKYFRHSKGVVCTGSLQSLFHKLAENVLEAHSIVWLPGGVEFRFDRCEREKERYGKRPDIYVHNTRADERLIVEIFYSHRIDPKTLETYLAHGERVMEIDISRIKGAFSSYEEFGQLILRTAPREILTLPELVNMSEVYEAPGGTSKESPIVSLESDWFEAMVDWVKRNWGLILGLAVLFLIYMMSRPRKRLATARRR